VKEHKQGPCTGSQLQCQTLPTNIAMVMSKKNGDGSRLGYVWSNGSSPDNNTPVKDIHGKVVGYTWQPDASGK